MKSEGQRQTFPPLILPESRTPPALWDVWTKVGSGRLGSRDGHQEKARGQGAWRVRHGTLLAALCGLQWQRLPSRRIPG